MQRAFPAAGKRLQLISIEFSTISLYVETLLSREMVTQVSPSLITYGLVQVGAGGAVVELSA